MSIGSFLPMLFHDPPRMRIAPNASPPPRRCIV
jgi:hypothetical protein